MQDCLGWPGQEERDAAISKTDEIRSLKERIRVSDEKIRKEMVKRNFYMARLNYLEPGD